LRGQQTWRLLVRRRYHLGVHPAPKVVDRFVTELLVGNGV
jgi:hypothetical protein